MICEKVMVRTDDSWAESPPCTLCVGRVSTEQNEFGPWVQYHLYVSKRGLTHGCSRHPQSVSECLIYNVRMGGEMNKTTSA